MAYKYYKDNRAYIKALLKTGDAVVVNEEVDWDLEMGAIVRRMCRRSGPRRGSMPLSIRVSP